MFLEEEDIISGGGGGVRIRGVRIYFGFNRTTPCLFVGIEEILKQSDVSFTNVDLKIASKVNEY
jgi:hypothetical protein